MYLHNCLHKCGRDYSALGCIREQLFHIYSFLYIIFFSNSSFPYFSHSLLPFDVPLVVVSSYRTTDFYFATFLCDAHQLLRFNCFVYNFIFILTCAPFATCLTTCTRRHICLFSLLRARFFGVCWLDFQHCFWTCAYFHFESWKAGNVKFSDCQQEAGYSVCNRKMLPDCFIAVLA